MYKILLKNQFKKLFFITKYKKLRAHEYKHWIFVILYTIIYFSIDAFARKSGIEFAIWDTVLTTTLLIIAIIIGNLFCGWACFMWRFQDIINIIGRFIFRGKYNNLISSHVRNKLKWLRYIVLVLMLGIPLILGSYKVFMFMWGLGFYLGLLFCLIDSHAYCKYFCFTGSLFKIGGLRNKSRLIRSTKKCIDCNICSKVCLHDCNPAKKITPLNRDLWCTSCFRCKTACPTKAIEFKNNFKKMKTTRIKEKLKKVVKVFGIIITFIILLLLIVPFFMSVKPLEDLVSVQQIAKKESKFVTIPFKGTDGIDIHYLEKESKVENDSMTFVLLHGSVFNSFTWNKVMDSLSEYGRVVAYDQIPYGLSEKLVEDDWNLSNPYSSEAQVEQLFSFIDTLELKNVVLVGNSYGSTLAVQATLERPEQVKALILSNPAVYVQENIPAWIMNLPQVRKLGPLLARGIGTSKSFISQTYLNPDKINDERMELTLIHTLIKDWDYALWEYLRVWNTPDISVNFPNIQQPTLIITGDSDMIVPVTDSKKLDFKLPNSELVILTSCGHVPQEECPESFEEALKLWLIKLQ